MCIDICIGMHRHVSLSTHRLHDLLTALHEHRHVHGCTRTSTRVCAQTCSKACVWTCGLLPVIGTSTPSRIVLFSRNKAGVAPPSAPSPHARRRHPPVGPLASVCARMCRWAGRWQQQSNDTGLALASQERYAQPPRLVTVVCTVVCRNDCRRTWARCTVSSLRHCAASSPMPAFPKGLASAHTHA